jgi:drug/metabolite transporter (DMT)-like permease
VPPAVPAPRWQVWTALGLVYVLWGSTYLGIRYTIETLPALLSAGARFGAAALLLAAWVALRRGRSAFRATRRELAGAAGTGVLLLMGGNGLVTLAQQQGLPSSLAALLVSSMPLWVVVVRAGTGDRPSSRTVSGVWSSRRTGSSRRPCRWPVGAPGWWSPGCSGGSRSTQPASPA